MAAANLSAGAGGEPAALRPDDSGSLLGDAAFAAAMDAGTVPLALCRGLAATLAPLSLHLLGWDKNRWNELLCLNAFLLLLMVSKLVVGEPARLPLCCAGVPVGDAAEHGVGRRDAGRQPYAAVPVYAQPGCGSLVQQGTGYYSSISTLMREAICLTCYRTARSCEFAGQPALFSLGCLPIMWRTRCVGR